MPNTLAHLGVQGVLSRLAWNDVDPKWIWVACVLPDVPWIVQRAALFLAPGLDPLGLRMYVGFQASLAGCLLLSAAVSSFSRARTRVMTILAANAVVHLILDTLQIKWGNGVHFFAPISWQSPDWGFFWPESVAGVVITIAGVLFLAATSRAALRRRGAVGTRPRHGWIVGLPAAAAYVFLPLAVPMPGEVDGSPAEAIHTADALRPGRQVQFDRASLVSCGADNCLRFRTGDPVVVESLPVGAPATVSVRGTITESIQIRVDAYHVHWPWYRDGASYLALFWIGLVLVLSVRGRSAS